MDFKKLLNIFFTGLNANLEKGFSRVVKAIEAQDVRPTIHVKAPDVKIPEIKLPTITIPEIKKDDSLSLSLMISKENLDFLKIS